MSMDGELKAILLEILETLRSKPLVVTKPVPTPPPTVTPVTPTVSIDLSPVVERLDVLIDIVSAYVFGFENIFVETKEIDVNDPIERNVESRLGRPGRSGFIINDGNIVNSLLSADVYLAINENQEIVLRPGEVYTITRGHSIVTIRIRTDSSNKQRIRMVIL